MFVIGVCRLPGRVLSVACGVCRYVFYRCVSVAWEIASTSCLSRVIACMLSALYVVAVSRAPSPESNPNSPLPVNATVGQDPTVES